MRVLTILMVLLFCSLSHAACTENSRVKFSFLNGVKNSFKQSEESSNSVLKILKSNHNFLKAQVPTESDLCLSVLYNQTYGILDFIETAGQKLRENQSVPFEWKNVAAFFLMKLSYLPLVIR